MKPIFNTLFFLTLFTSFALAQASNECCDVTPCFSPRSQGRDKVRQLVGTTDHIFLYDPAIWYGNFSVMVEYTRSFRPHEIARCLFGCSLNDNCDCPDTIKIQGCKVENRDKKAWLADYFYLPSDFDGTISFEPRISNVNIDFDLFMGMDEWLKGLYLRVYGPITHTRWDLNLCECVNSAGECDHPEGYFTPDKLTRDKLLNNFSEYACGQSPEDIPNTTVQTVTRVKDGVTFQPLKFAKLDPCERTKTGFADLRLEFGWNYHQKKNTVSRWGANIQAAAPTGNKNKTCFLFDTVVGNGNHWELGAGITAHHIFWRNDDESKEFGMYFDASATHLFSARQLRTFDLCNKPNSRYMLAQKLGTPVELLVGHMTSNTTPNKVKQPSAQFKGEFAPVANLTTLDVKVTVPAQGDLTVMFNFSWPKWQFDFGYNFWGRACEKFECPEKCGTCCPSLCDESQKDMWALKGDAHVFGFASSGQLRPLENKDPVALSATQSNATICKGTSGDTAKKTNCSIDNPRFALAQIDDHSNFVSIKLLNNITASDSAVADQIKTSLDPVLLQCDDINFLGTRGISHKIFAHFNYHWELNSDWQGFVGFGAFGEFGKTESLCCTCDPCDTSIINSSKCNKDYCIPCFNNCIDCSFSQWGVWIKGGVLFFGHEE